jgi:hypothetical protein
MRITSITASITCQGEADRRINGKEIFFSVTAKPEGESWSWSEAQIAYFTLMRDLSVSTNAAMMARRMLSQDQVMGSNSSLRTNFGAILTKLEASNVISK